MPGADAAAAAIDALILRLDAATRGFTSDAVHMIGRGAKTLAHVKTGTLRRSILPTPVVRVSAHVWTARVGPTVVYGRQKELGGDIYPVRAQALRFIAADGALIYTQHVYQKPQPYLKPAVDEAFPRMRGVLERRVRDAILG